MDHADRDARIRLQAFAFLDQQRQAFGGDLPWRVLHEGFLFDGDRVPLVGPQGIFKPKVLTRPVPLSITTAPPRPGRRPLYDDAPGPDGLFFYRYRGDDPEHHENEGLRTAMREQIPLVYFVGIAVGWYSAAYPAYVVGDDPARLTVTVAADDRAIVGIPAGGVAENTTEARRAYATQMVKRRIHQDRFRHNVLVAYHDCCAICRLRHRQLLEAAHIIPDSDPRGTPEVNNGLALCKLHHAAFDSHIVGIRPNDLVVEIRESVRRETDGPMLLHGLQNCHGQPLVVVPRQAALRPREDFLAERYERFRRAG